MRLLAVISSFGLHLGKVYIVAAALTGKTEASQKVTH